MKPPPINPPNGEHKPTQPFTINPEVAANMHRGQEARRIARELKDCVRDTVEGLLDSNPDHHADLATVLEGEAHRVRGIKEEKIRKEREAQRKKEAMRGKYICIEGPDGSGKSTLAKALADHYKAQPQDAAHVWFPSESPVGTLIRKGLRGEIALDPKTYLYLFCADGLQMNAVIEYNLAQGKHVICDRHPTLSGRVFQVDRHPEESVEKVYNLATQDGILKPDILFVLDVPPDVTLARMKTREKYKDVVFESDDIVRVTQLRNRYMILAARFGAQVLDATATPEVLAQKIIAAVGDGFTSIELGTGPGGMVAT